jgi:glycosyltransferase involved in cell wall biosynthesis
MSMVLLEALAAGKAVVATAVGETPLVVRHGVDGIVTEAKDIDAMTDALSELILDEKKREDMGRTAKARYLEAFTAEQMAARYQVLYDSLLDKD